MPLDSGAATGAYRLGNLPQLLRHRPELRPQREHARRGDAGPHVAPLAESGIPRRGVRGGALHLHAPAARRVMAVRREAACITGSTSSTPVTTSTPSRPTSRAPATSTYRDHMTRGLEFFKRHFFREDGCPRYYHDRTQPIDSQCAAQAIETLSRFAETRPGVPGAGAASRPWTIATCRTRTGTSTTASIRSSRRRRRCSTGRRPRCIARLRSCCHACRSLSIRAFPLCVERIRTISAMSVAYTDVSVRGRKKTLPSFRVDSRVVVNGRFRRCRGLRPVLADGEDAAETRCSAERCRSMRRGRISSRLRSVFPTPSRNTISHGRRTTSP